MSIMLIFGFNPAEMTTLFSLAPKILASSLLSSTQGHYLAFSSCQPVFLLTAPFLLEARSPSQVRHVMSLLSTVNT